MSQLLYIRTLKDELRLVSDGTHMPEVREQQGPWCQPSGRLPLCNTSSHPRQGTLQGTNSTPESQGRQRRTTLDEGQAEVTSCTRCGTDACQATAERAGSPLVPDLVPRGAAVCCSFASSRALRPIGRVLNMLFEEAGRAVALVIWPMACSMSSVRPPRPSGDSANRGPWGRGGRTGGCSVSQFCYSFLFRSPAWCLPSFARSGESAIPSPWADEGPLLPKKTRGITTRMASFVLWICPA